MIEQQLLETGILQLGLFAQNGTQTPYRLRLDLLPAYPDLFRAVTDKVIAALPETHFDRLVAEADTTALGAAVSLQTGISLVYSRGCGEAPVHDLAGAYNFGHPALLLVNTVTPTIGEFIETCARV